MFTPKQCIYNTSFKAQETFQKRWLKDFQNQPIGRRAEVLFYNHDLAMHGDHGVQQLHIQVGPTQQAATNEEGTHSVLPLIGELLAANRLWEKGGIVSGCVPISYPARL